VKWVLAGAALLAAAASLLLLNRGSVHDLKVSADQSILGRSGFLGAFSLIFVSEIGDKTFFIAGLLAAKVGRMRSLVGSTTALALMTVISVCIGAAFKSLPEVMKSSLPVGQYLGAALMLLFGVRTIKEAWESGGGGVEDSGDELQEAQLSVSAAEKEGVWSKQNNLWQTLLQVGTLIFVAEWGDRSMLATIAFAASHPPVGVALGATLAHAVATAIAVASGSIASQYVSEKTIGYIGGVLFLIFSVLTFYGYF
jgi:putative Ca2+/H+ antiporter (TMEM165/GDT1 family)